MLVFLLILSMSVPYAAAEVNFAYPKAATKKGLYVTPGMEEDALELGIRHATINLSVGDFMPGPGYQNDACCYAYTYGQKTYWISRAAVAQYDRELGRLAQNNVLVYAILLLPYRSDLKNLIYPAARQKGANYDQWNMTDPEAVNTLRAIITFFQRRYSNKNGARIVGWIVGNEVNNSRTWNWGGNISFSTYVDLYAAECAEVLRTARSVYRNVRIYMCLDHYWGKGNGSYWYAGRKFLKKFASRMKARKIGQGIWHIAYHPYNVDLGSADIMASSAAVTGKANSAIVTMKNLGVLTRYVRDKYSRKCRIILSEQGYSSVTGGKNAAADQARNVALAYYIAQNNSMVDALILHRQVDHSLEAADGAAYGLYTSSGGENALEKKPAWDTYRLADTTRTNKYTRYAAKQAKKVTGQAIKKVFQAEKGKLMQTAGLAWKKYYMNGAVGYGALAEFGVQAANNAYMLRHDPARNANVVWGLRRKGKVNCKSLKKLGFGIQVNGSTNGQCRVTVRLWAGKKKYFEAKKVIACQAPAFLYTDLKKWKYRGRISRIDILITPVGGRWSRDANALIYAIGTGR